jgi:hypothetical protein
MGLRSELMPPVLDEAVVRRLAERAAKIDGARPGQWEDELAAFNAEANTRLAFGDFQGIYASQDHATWVRSVLSAAVIRPLPDITRDELIELVRRVESAEYEEHETHFWLQALKANLPDVPISDLIFWPDEALGADLGDDELSPERIVDLALTRWPSDGRAAAG